MRLFYGKKKKKKVLFFIGSRHFIVYIQFSPATYLARVVDGLHYWYGELLSVQNILNQHANDLVINSL